jgi:hypothetical protein
VRNTKHKQQQKLKIHFQLEKENKLIIDKEMLKIFKGIFNQKRRAGYVVTELGKI